VVVFTLALAGAVQLVTAASFIAVGARLRRRWVSPRDRLANQALVAWWWGLAAYMLMQGAFGLAGAVGWTSLSAYVASRALAGLLICFAAWGLAYHILFLFTGWRRLAIPLGLYYAVVAVAYDRSILNHHPLAVVAGDWEVLLVFASPLADPLWTAVLASVGLPPVLGSLAYLTLLRKVEMREQRYRIILVATSIILWVTTGFAAQVGGGPFLKYLTVVVFGLLASIVVFAAYFPPAPVRRWLGMGAPGRPGSPPAPPPPAQP
jgi:hypothetical protein